MPGLFALSINPDRYKGEDQEGLTTEAPKNKRFSCPLIRDRSPGRG